MIDRLVDTIGLTIAAVCAAVYLIGDGATVDLGRALADTAGYGPL